MNSETKSRLVSDVARWKSVALATLVLLLGCCGAIAQSSQTAGGPDKIKAGNRSSGQMPRDLSPPGSPGDGETTILVQSPENSERPRLQTFEGTGQFIGGRKGGIQPSAPGDITLDFADTDIRDVVRSILGDMLHLPYAIDPQINGRVTVRTGAPISKSDVLPAFETALKVSGAAIVVNNGIYDVVPMSEAQKRASLIRRYENLREPGYGIEIVPLHYIAADEMEKILTPLVPQGGIANVDSGRNLLFLVGTEPDRASMRETIALFDVDYLKSMSYAIIQPVHVDPETLAAELDKVFEGTGSPVSGLVRLIPISRINSLLVVTARSSYLREVSEWVSRLDVPPIEPGRRLYYYRLQNARAADIAQTLGQLFGGVSAAPATDKAVTAPILTPSIANANGQSGGNSSSVSAFNFAPPTASTAASVGGSATTSASGSVSPFGMPRGPGDSGGGPQIVTDEANNALIIRADRGDYASIERVIKEMDVAPDQVLIEATIAEVTLNDALQYGVEWYFQSGAAQAFNFSQTGKVSESFPGFAFSYMVPNVQATLSTLGTVSHVNIISSPRVLTLDNKTASLQVGNQVPVATQTAVSVNESSAPLVSTVQMESTGVILTVTPRIGKSGMVFLDVTQQVSDAIPTTTSSIASPTIEQRQVQASVAIEDGQTVALGGLIQTSTTQSDSGIPFLMDVPVLGNLVKTVNHQKSRTELLVFLTPHVVRDPQAAHSMTDELTTGLDEVRRAMEEQKKKS